MADLTTLAWPATRLGEALEALARSADPEPRLLGPVSPPTGFLWHDAEVLGRWLAAAAVHLGLEAEPTEIPYGEVEHLLQRVGPALLRLPGAGEPRVLALLGGGCGMVSLLGPDLAIHRLQRAVVSAALCRELEAPLAAEVDRLLVEAGVPRRRQTRARTAILRERLGPTHIGSCWCLRLPSHLVALIGGHAVQYLLWLLAWWMVGQGALQGRLDSGWLLAWALLLVTLVPFRLLATWSQGVLAIGAGRLLKQRLLSGALRLEPEEIRHQGAGQLLGRVIEVEAVEALALSGGFLGLVAGMELLIAAAVLGIGAGGGTHALLLLAWVTVALLLGWQY